MNKKQLAIVFGIVAVVLIAVIALLATGGSDPVLDPTDPADDVEVGDGDDAPTETGLADIVSSTVTSEGGNVVFEAQMASEIPERATKDLAIDWKWDLFEDGNSTWVLSGNLDVGANATLVATGQNYTSSTIDETLPSGAIEIVGETVRISFDPSEVPAFPSQFTWQLSTSLDGARGDASSALATDQHPDEGFGEYKPDSE